VCVCVCVCVFDTDYAFTHHCTGHKQNGSALPNRSELNPVRYGRSRSVDNYVPFTQPTVGSGPGELDCADVGLKMHINCAYM
jgi:hypothetical protein